MVSQYPSQAACCPCEIATSDASKVQLSTNYHSVTTNMNMPVVTTVNNNYVQHVSHFLYRSLGDHVKVQGGALKATHLINLVSLNVVAGTCGTFLKYSNIE